MRQRRLIIGAVLVAALIAAAVFADRSGVICLERGSPGPATHAEGPLTVATDASVYTPDGSVLVTFTNHLSGPIELFAHILFQGEKCAGDALQRRVGADWQEADLVQCHNEGEGAPPSYTGLPYEVFLGSEFPARIDLGGSLASGTYRYVARYVLFDTSRPNEDANYYVQFYPTATRIFSQPFRVCTCAVCS